MRCSALIFARYNSTRLPGKVLHKIGDKSVLEICVNKLEVIPDLGIIVATSDRITDKPIWEWCEENDVEYYCGDLENVSLRAAKCLQKCDCDYFFRVNADSPFLQVDLLNRAKEIIDSNSNIDIVTNVLERSYPYGITVELVKRKVFLDNIENFGKTEQEHITSYFYKNSEKFKIKNIKYEMTGMGPANSRWVLDTPEDLERIRTLLDKHPNLFNYSLKDLLKIY